MSTEGLAPQLGNQFDDDPVLRRYLQRVLPPEVYGEAEASLRHMGEQAGGELYRMQLAGRDHEPVHTPWSAWGERIDHIEPTPLWGEARRIAAERGVVATAYEMAHGAYSRIHQFALAYLFTPSTDFYSCPLAMTDGAATTLLGSGNSRLMGRAIPHLTARDPEQFWTSGQWMTEISGGSDVSGTETVARLDGGVWRLYGEKWFTSATESEIALTLARPEGNPPGSPGLALFYVETGSREAGGLRGIRVNRLKDKLGTRKVPTAELTLEGTPAEPVAGTSHGVQHIAPMLNVTRAWNAVSAAALMRRGLALARDYARRRRAFGAPLAEHPLHVDTLAALQAEADGAFHLAFRVAELRGRQEANEISQKETVLLRLLTSLAKLTTGKQAVAVASEIVEAFGGAGYVEDTGIPVLLRDAQVLPIWEGTTNVLSLDALHVLTQEGGMEVFQHEIEGQLKEVRDPQLVPVAEGIRAIAPRAATWVRHARSSGLYELEAGARRLALTLGRLLESALLLNQAQWSLEKDGDGRAAAAARRLFANGVDLITEVEPQDSQTLVSADALFLPQGIKPPS
jgi:acyl-CoA dehydrogenase